MTDERNVLTHRDTFPRQLPEPNRGPDDPLTVFLGISHEELMREVAEGKIATLGVYVQDEPIALPADGKFDLKEQKATSAESTETRVA
jgi:hypothetical protein